MSNPVHISASNLGANVIGAPSEIVYLPQGKHEISATVDGEPGQKTVIVSAGIEAAFQQDLSDRLSQNVRPFLDFEHQEGKASGIPKSFKWVEGQGLVLEIEWSKSGREAIEGKDFSYFSPSFLINGETPSGLLDSGAIGGLVNEPAFRKISRIAASAAASKTKQKAKSTMNELVTAGILSESEAAQEGAVHIAAKRYQSVKENAAEAVKAKEQVTSLTKDLEEVKASLEAANSELDKQKKQRAEDKIQAAVKAGQIPPKDEATQKFWVKAMLNDPEGTSAALDALPKTKVGEKIVTGGSGDPGEGEENAILAAFNKAKLEGKDHKECMSIVRAHASADPAAYKQYRESLAAAAAEKAKK